MPYVTFEDALDRVLAYLGSGNAKPETVRDARRAIFDALRDLANEHEWFYYQTLGQLLTVAQQTTGTITFDYTGGTYERMVTLSGATWPTWAPYGVLRISDVDYQVEDRKSATVLTLLEATNPGDDVAAGTSYTLYRDTYPLPADCVRVDRLRTAAYPDNLEYFDPRDWLADRRVRGPSGSAAYTFTGDADNLGRLAVRLGRATEAVTYDFLYRRRPRDVSVQKYDIGTVACTSAGTTLTGTSTVFTSAMVGSVVRLSANATTGPTPQDGANPAAQERRIKTFTSTTALEVDSAWTQSLDPVKYEISDPVDVEQGAMLSAFWHLCYLKLAALRPMDEKKTAMVTELYRAALKDAKAWDSRVRQNRRAGGWPGMWAGYLGW